MAQITTCLPGPGRAPAPDADVYRGLSV